MKHANPELLRNMRLVIDELYNSADAVDDLESYVGPWKITSPRNRGPVKVDVNGIAKENPELRDMIFESIEERMDEKVEELTKLCRAFYADWRGR